MSDSEPEFEDQEFALGGHRFVVSTVVELGLEQLSKLERASDEISGQRAWPGSLLLCAYLLDHPEVVVGSKACLELGAGCGLASMLAAKLGAKRVVASDGDDRCLRRLRENVKRNFKGDEAACAVERLFWGDKASHAAFEAAQGGSSFHVVLAGDVLYKRALVDPFLTALEKNLAPGGVAYLCHLPRAGVTQAAVVAALEAAGFDHRPCVLRADDVLDGQDCTADDVQAARLYELRRKEEP